MVLGITWLSDGLCRVVRAVLLGELIHNTLLVGNASARGVEVDINAIFFKLCLKLEVSTNTPDCYFVTIIPERIEPYDIVIDKLEPQPDDAKVTVSYFSNTQSVEPGSDGSYRTQVSNEHNVTVTVSATGYRTKTFYMSHGYVGVWELGTVELEPLPVSGLVRANITVNGKDTLRSFDGLNPTLTLNGSEKIDMRDCELSFPYIILKQAVLDKLYLDSKLTMTLDPDHDLRLTGGSVDIDLETASCALDISKMGYAEISLGIQNKNNTVIIFDSLGRLVDNGSASTLYTTERMNKGAYTAVAFEKNPYIFSAVSLDSFRSAGLEEGTDYAIAAFTVDNNKKTPLALSVPKFTKEPGNGFLDRGGCSVRALGSDFRINQGSLMAAGTTSFIPKIGKPASVMVTEVMEIGLGPTHIRNSYQRPTLETKRDLAEKRMIRILQKLQEQGGGNTPDPTKPTDATEPTGITNPTDSTNPTSSTAPTDSTSPTQGTEPAEDPDELTDAEKKMEDWYYKNLEKKSTKDGTDTKPIRDPSGIIYEALEENALAGVTATIWYSPNADGSGAVIWNAENFDQINPQITTSENGYMWLVPDGYWQVQFEKDGYEAAQTEWLEVPPPRMGLTTPMISKAAPKLAAAAAYPDYVELIFDQYMDMTVLITAEGYTPAWANASASPDGKQLSRVLRLAYSVPKKAGDQVAVTTAGGKNYAGREFDGYTGELTVVERPVSLTVDQSAVETYVGGSSKVAVQVLGTDGKPLSGVKLTASARESVKLDSTSGMTDSEGKAVFNVTGAEVGVAVLAIVADNTTLKQEVQIVVHADA